MNKTVLILGGYGTFGARVAVALARDPDLRVLVAGRDPVKAAAHCREFGGQPVMLDRGAPDLEAQIGALAPDLVIDAAGPFQAYGADAYRLARAALGVGAHYLDLSDDGGFTQGIGELDGMAKAAGLAALSGVSSVPALSSAAVRALSDGFSDIHLIDSVILPGNRAPRGRSVIRAILAQVGQPLRLWRDGVWETQVGWSGLVRVGLPGLGRRWASLIGAPDLQVFPTAFGARVVVFRAGLELSVMHLGVSALGLLVRTGLLKSVEPMARLLQVLANLLKPFGSDRGGMRVRVAGITEAGQAEMRDWHLCAGAGDGPEVPAIPARILAVKALKGLLEPGARAAIAEISLTEVAMAARDFDIGFSAQSRPFVMIFPAVLGASFLDLAPALRDLHQVIALRRWTGLAKVTRGKGLLARLVAWIMRFPAAGEALKVSVVMRRVGDSEVWTRDFSGKRFRSHLRQERDGGLTERFGPMRFRIGIAVRDQGLIYPLTKGWFLGIPIPQALLPRSETREFVDEQGRACFDVALSHAVTGPIVRYQGVLQPKDRV